MFYILDVKKKSILKLSALSVQTKIVWLNLFQLLDFASEILHQNLQLLKIGFYPDFKFKIKNNIL